MLADLLAVEKRMKVFVLGATGYIGGAVAHALVQDGHEVSGLSRSTDKAEQLRLRGVSPTIGTLFDRELLVRTARAADAVVNAADSDNAYAVTALLEAFAGTDKRIVHTSGSSIVGDRAGGQLADSIYNDNSRPAARLEKQGRTAIDDAILREATNGVVICPTMVYGVGTGLHTESVQIPILARLARELGAGVHIGAGNNRWSNVQIDDLVNLYRLALTDAPAGAFLFAENGEASMRELAAAIGERLGFYGPTTSLSPKEGIRRLGAEASEFALGSNSRAPWAFKVSISRYRLRMEMPDAQFGCQGCAAHRQAMAAQRRNQFQQSLSPRHVEVARYGFLETDRILPVNGSICHWR